MSNNTYHTKVAGVTFGNRQERVRWRRRGSTVFLVRELDNPYDENAIRVEHSEGGQIGYIPRGLAGQIAPQLDAVGGIAEATVVELTGGTGAYPHRGLIISFSLPTSDVSTSLRSFGRICLGRKSPSVSAAISGNDELLVVAYTQDTHLEVWQCRPLKLLSDVQLKGSYDSYTNVAVSQSGDKVAILDRDKSDSKIQILDSWTGSLLATLELPRIGSKDYKMRFSQADDFFVVGCIARDPHECLIAGWRTDTWEEVIHNSKEMPHEDISGSYPHKKNISDFYPLLLDPDNRTVLFEVITAPLSDKSILQWLDIGSMKVCKQLLLPGKISRVVEAGPNLVAVFGGKMLVRIINTNSLEAIESFIPPCEYIYAILAELKLFLYGTTTGDANVEVDYFHAHEYGSSSQSPVTRYLEGKLEWSFVCSSPSGRAFVVREYASFDSSEPDYLAVFGDPDMYQSESVAHQAFAGRHVHKAEHRREMPAEQRDEDEQIDAQELIQRYKTGERDFVRIHLPRGVNLRGVNLEEADLEGARLMKADLERANLCGANLRWARLAGTNLRFADLCMASLPFAMLRETDLSGADLEGSDLTNANLEEANLEGTNLSGANLAGANLYKAAIDETTRIDDQWRQIWEIMHHEAIGRNLMDADLGKVNLPGAHLEEANLSRANLEAVNLEGANLHRANLKNTNLSKANLRRANLSETNLEEVNNLREARLKGANLSRTNLRGCSLRETDLESVNLNGANLEQADLYGAVLRYATLKETCLNRANLCKADLKRANLEGADLRGVDFTGADLKEASLKGADLSGAILSDANLEEANLSGANLEGSNLKGANLCKAIVDEVTRFDTKWRWVWEIVNQGAVGCNLMGTDLREARLRCADLRGANLVEADLSSCDLRGANLSEANLGRANFEGAYLREADLSVTQLEEANLSETNLIGVQLSMADMHGANLSKANLALANLIGADLTGAWLEEASLIGAEIDETTKIDEKWRQLVEIVQLKKDERDLQYADFDQEVMVVSEPLYLQDLSDEVKQLEGENCPRDKQAWVIVRQATEADNERRVAPLAGRTAREMWNYNPNAVLEVAVIEIYCCLCGAGNIVDAEGNPLFRFKDIGNYRKLDMTYEEFKRVYSGLSRSVKAAIQSAVLEYNPDWDPVKMMFE